MYIYIIYKLQGKPPDWQDFVGIVVLLCINSTISFYEENSAGNAAAALMAGLAPKTKAYIYIYTHMFLDLFLIEMMIHNVKWFLLMSVY